MQHRRRAIALLLGVCAALPSSALAQAVPAQADSLKPSVFVREVRIDSLLLAFGVDSARVRAAVVGAVRGARRLVTDSTTAAPSLDVVVTVPRLLTGGMLEPRGYVHVEVGRNLMESGKANALVWEGHFTLPESPTWRELSRTTLAEVLFAVHKYLMPRGRGA